MHSYSIYTLIKRGVSTTHMHVHTMLSKLKWLQNQQSCLGEVERCRSTFIQHNGREEKTCPLVHCLSQSMTTATGDSRKESHVQEKLNPMLQNLKLEDQNSKLDRQSLIHVHTIHFTISNCSSVSLQFQTYHPLNNQHVCARWPWPLEITKSYLTWKCVEEIDLKLESQVVLCNYFCSNAF